MPLAKTPGNITTDGTDQQVVLRTGDAFRGFQINVKNMADNDQIKLTFKIKINTEVGVVLDIYDDKTITNAQTKPVFNLPPLPGSEFEVRIQRLAGTDRAYDWTVWELT